MSERSELSETFFDAVGGAATFDRLVDRFYEGVAEDPVLRPMYPEEDLTGARRRLSLFLQQYWGGPGTYSAERGHPRLRMRHMPFKVNEDAHDRWLTHMAIAVKELQLPAELESQLWQYMVMAARSLINSFEPTEAEGS